MRIYKDLLKLSKTTNNPIQMAKRFLTHLSLKEIYVTKGNTCMINKHINVMSLEKWKLKQWNTPLKVLELLKNKQKHFSVPSGSKDVELLLIAGWNAKYW